MAQQHTTADSRRALTVDPPPLQIPRDMQSSDNPIPLSPQWLLPKSGDNKEFSSPPVTRPDSLKLPGNGDDLHSVGKKKEAFRPSFHDIESGRRDRWHEEERETNSAFRRGRWRDGDKESSETRKMDRWSETPSKPGEARRVVPEKWNDSGNRDGDQRGENKWNARRVPDDKESESWREKWSNSNRDDVSSDKGITPFGSHGKETNNHAKEGEREDHYSRPWRAYSSSGRGRGDSFNHQPQVSSKQSSVFGHGRGKAESATPVLAVGRGRFTSSTNVGSSAAKRSFNLGGSYEKFNSSSSEPSIVKYNRMKLLDIYRSTDMKNYKLLLEGFVEVPSLTQDEPLEPLALSAPTPDESVILKGIDKGDIVSSGVPQASKDGSIGRSAADAVSSRHNKLGSSEELPVVGNVYKEATSRDIEGEETIPPGIGATSTEVIRQDRTSYVVPQRSQTTGDHTRSSLHDWKDLSMEMGSRELDLTRQQRDLDFENKINNSVLSSSYKEVDNWQGIGAGFHSNANLKHHPSEAVEDSKVNMMLSDEDSFNSRETSYTNSLFPHGSPEELSLYYRDPQGQIQGPFSGSDLIGWFEAGYFGIDLPVKLANSPIGAPFSSLGDVMPHLKMKARPPPGFSVGKQSDTLEESLRSKLESSSTVNQGFIGFEAHNSGQKTAHDSVTEAQNRLLESFMSANVHNNTSKENFSLSRGTQDYGGSGSGIVSSLGGESVNNMNYLLAQTRLLERQRSIPNALPLWSNKDVPSAMPNINSKPDSSQLLSASSNVAHQSLSSPQHIDVMSLLQSAAEAQPSVVNSGLPLWPNFNDARAPSKNIHGGIELKDTVGVHNHMTSQFGFGMQQMSQQPNQPPLHHTGNQSGNLSSSFVFPETMFASDVSQDPGVLSILQQQYLLSQLQSQSHAPVPTQLSMLDKILLLQQQLKQEQQQHQMLMQQQQQQVLMQQQQHLLSQVFSGHQPFQHFADPSYGLGRTAIPDGNVPTELNVSQRIHDEFANQHVAVPNLYNSQPSYLPVRDMENSQIVSSVGSGPTPIHLPHQIINQMVDSQTSNASPLPDDDILNLSIHETTKADSLPTSYDINNSEQEIFVARNNNQYLDTVETEHYSQSISQASQMTLPIASNIQQSSDAIEDPKTSEVVSLVSEQVQVMKISEEKLPRLPKSESTTSSEQVNIALARDVKKSSEKKSRKQKKSKAEASSDLEKEIPKPCPSKKLNAEDELASEVLTDGNSVIGSSLVIGFETAREQSDSQASQRNSTVPISINETEIVEGEAETVAAETQISSQQTTSASRAWKPALGLKPKSLLEIQQEEQLRAQRETVHSEVASNIPPASAPISSPWTGLVANIENKSNKDSSQASKVATMSGNSGISSKSKKSQLHDLLAEDVLAKYEETDTENSAYNSKLTSLPPPSPANAQAEPLGVDADDFIEAKDTRKSRKRASKSKAAGTKSPSPVGSADLSSFQTTSAKGKVAHQIQVEKESLPAPSAGPSLADFVPWKGEQASSTPAPAWSLDSANSHRPTSLRDILREQEKVKGPVQPQVPVPIPSKVQNSRSSRGSSWQVTGSSPTDTQTSLHGSGHSKSKSKSEDDLFWGPPEQSKSERKLSEHQSLANSSMSVKGTSKATAGTVNRQKSLGGKPEQALSSLNSASLLPKGKADASTKKTEAMDFRNWCESEWIKLTGTNDTSFLEFCIKQSTSEAEILLRENLGSLDRNDEFIDKFLNYKDFLSTDVIEIAFQAKRAGSRNSGDNHRVGNSAVATNRNAVGTEDEFDGQTKGGATKKKGKKGQKVSASVLGFNVVSNRIMMGEIQNVED